MLASACLLSNSAVLGQLATTRLTSIFPAGGQQGTQLDVTITAGTDLEGVNRLWFSHPGITAIQKTAVPEGKTDPEPVANQFRVSIGTDVAPGLYELRAVGIYGISNPRAFVVGDRPEIAESEPNNSREQATEIPAACWANGRSEPAKDVDYFRFAAKAGERLVIEVWAERVDSKIDATLELYDAQGRLLQLVRDFNHHDPLIDFRVPADGEYFLKLYDLQFHGGTDYHYRLGISTAPYIDFVFPPTGLPGSTQQYTVYGRNLPGGSPTDLSIDAAPLEHLTVEIPLPGGEIERQRLTFDSVIEPPAAALDGVNYRLSGPGGVSNPALISFASAPVVIEQEPNDEAPQAVTPNCEIAGQFGRRGDRDQFSFTARKDEVYWIEVYSQRLGAPTDPLLTVEQVTTNDKGEAQVKELKSEDDTAANVGGQSFNTASADPVFQLACPADGEYRVRIQDLHADARGNPRMVYRLAIRQAAPDFRLVAIPDFPADGQQAPNVWTNFLRKGGTSMLRVLALRRDGFAGEIVAHIDGLPEGVTCRPATIGPNQPSAMLVLEAREDAPDWVGTIRVRGAARVGDADLVREARPATVLVAAQNQRGISRLSRDLALAVGQTAPYLLQAKTSEVRVPQGHWIEIPLSATRRGDFTGDLALTAMGLPAKVQNEALTLAAAEHDATMYLFAEGDAPPGKYSIYVQSSTQVPFTKNADGSDKKPVAVVDASTPVEVTIVPGPVVLAPKPPNNGNIPIGAKLEVPVEINRRNGFAGPVTLDLYLPAGTAGLQAAEVLVPADQSSGTIVVEVAPDAAEGPRPRVAVRARVEIGGQPIELHQPIPLVIQK
jgi:hypothetical protein